MISVIVPVYKVEEYLDRCVESIVNQTYRDLEIILVDDGSPDSCPEMCDEWARKDSRIRVIHKKNGGLSDARNAGYSVVKGDYTAFVDSDDWIHPMFYELLLDAITKSDCDIAECGYISTKEYSDFYVQQKSVPLIITSEDALKKNLAGVMFHDVVWNKLYKTSVAAVPFEVGKQHEDVFWTYQVLARANKCVHIENTLYFYFQRQSSIMGQRYSLKRLDSVDALENKCRYMISRYPDLTAVAQGCFIGFCMYNTQLLSESEPDAKRELTKQLRDRAKAIGDGWKKSKEISKKQKLWYRLFFIAPIFTCKIRNFLGIGK